MKKIVLILGSFLLSSMALANTSAQSVENQKEQPQLSEEAGQFNIVTRHEIMGLWGMEIPKNQQCLEYYNFSSPTDVVINSAQEWSIGQYQYQVPGNRSEQYPALIMQIKYDNNEKDCSGVQQDQTGEIQQFFVKWVSPKQIQFCASNKGDNCFATLNRVLP